MQIKETVEESVGRQIQKIRRERGYTQQVFSEMVGISTNYLSDVERCKKSVRLEKLVPIMNELQCSADDLFMDKIELDRHCLTNSIFDVFLVITRQKAYTRRFLQCDNQESHKAY